MRPVSLVLLSFAGLLSAATPAFAEPLVLRDSSIDLIDRADLAANQSGVIASEVPAEGEVVEKDQLVVQLDDRVPRAALEVARVSASSDVDKRVAEKTFDVAKNEYIQANEANKLVVNTISKLEVDRLYLTGEKSRLEIEKSEHQMSIAKAQEHEAEMLLQTFRIEAPFSGVVRQRLKRKGEAVRQGDPIVEVISTARMRVIAQVPVDSVSRVRVGQEVEVIPDYEPAGTTPFGSSNEPLIGTVRFLDVRGDNIDKVVPVLIDVPNPDGRLIGGFSATVRIP